MKPWQKRILFKSKGKIAIFKAFNRLQAQLINLFKNAQVS